MLVRAVGVLVILPLLCGLTSARSNIDTEQCPISSGCLQCMSSRSAEVERCMQLNFLITQAVSFIESDPKKYICMDAGSISQLRLIKMCLHFYRVEKLQSDSGIALGVVP